MRKSLVISDAFFQRKESEFLQFRTNSLCYIGHTSVDDPDSNPLDLVLGVHKGAEHRGHLILTMVEALISVEKFLTLS